MGWGDDVDGRGLSNATSKSKAPADELKAAYDACKDGSVDTIVTWSGEWRVSERAVMER